MAFTRRLRVYRDEHPRPIRQLVAQPFDKRVFIFLAGSILLLFPAGLPTPQSYSSPGYRQSSA
jgi:hypothetical protein